MSRSGDMRSLLDPWLKIRFLQCESAIFQILISRAGTNIFSYFFFKHVLLREIYKTVCHLLHDCEKWLNKSPKKSCVFFTRNLNFPNAVWYMPPLAFFLVFAWFIENSILYLPCKNKVVPLKTKPTGGFLYKKNVNNKMSLWSMFKYTQIYKD